MKRIRFIMLVIFSTMVIFSFDCRRDSAGNDKPQNIEFNSNTLTLARDSNHFLWQKDYLLIGRCFSKVQKINSVFSDTKCSENIQFYDRANALILRRSLQHCMSDMRMEWRQDSYFEVNGKPVLEISYDGMDKILKINREYNLRQ